MNRHLRAISNLLLDNLLLKISSAFLALLLWIAINGEPQSETRFKVRLQYLNLPSEIELVDSPTNSVDVQLSASSSILRRLDSAEISASIDLATARVGKGVYSITPSNIDVPFGVRVTNVTPSTVQLNLQSTVSKEVKVHPRVVGRVTDGYQLESVALHPDQVVVEGAGESVTAVTRVFTDGIDLTGRSTSFATRVRLVAEGGVVRFPNGRWIDVEVVIRSLGQRLDQQEVIP